MVFKNPPTTVYLLHIYYYYYTPTIYYDIICSSAKASNVPLHSPLFPAPKVGEGEKYKVSLFIESEL